MRAFLIRDYDGSHGAKLAQSLEGCYGLDILTSHGSIAKCAAAQGNNCQDAYAKLFPPRMFLDQETSELLRPLLDGAMQAVNAHLLRAGERELNLRDLDKSGPLIGEVQILRFKAASVNQGVGGRMHIHVDKPGTRWVAIMALGESPTFCLDNAMHCKRCFISSRREEDARKEIRPNLNCGGTGVAKVSVPGGAQLGAKDWHKIPCSSCRELHLQSGDILLFDGNPAAHIAHGSLSTKMGDAPGGLPLWCYGGRVSCQYRLTGLS